MTLVATRSSKENRPPKGEQHPILTCLTTGAHSAFELTHHKGGAPGQETEELERRWWPPDCDPQGAGAPGLKVRTAAELYSNREGALSFRSTVPTGIDLKASASGVIFPGDTTHNCNPYWSIFTCRLACATREDQWQDRAHEEGQACGAEEVLGERGPKQSSRW